MTPRVTIVLEGYNEFAGLGESDEVFDGLLNQDFPLEEAELLLVGTPDQLAAWEPRFADPRPFGAVRAVAQEGSTYYAVKATGVRHASAPLLAFLDSDTIPARGWLRALVGMLEAGADITAGPTFFNGSGHPAVRLASAAVFSGFAIGTERVDGVLAARAFSMHNFGLRASVAERHRFEPEMGHSFSDVHVWTGLGNEGGVMRWSSEQRVSHSFSQRWWLGQLQPRVGYEMVALPRGRKREAIERRRPAILDLARNAVGGVHTDLLTWPHWSASAGVEPARRVRMLPLVLLVSVVAHTARLAGATAWLLRPKATARWAKHR